MKRWGMERHELHDYETQDHFLNRDKGFIHIANVLYEEMEEIKRLIRVYGGDEDDY